MTLPLVPEEEFAKKLRPQSLKRASYEIAKLVLRIVNTPEREKVECQYVQLLVLEGTLYNSNFINDRAVPAHCLQAFRTAQRKLFTQILESNRTRSDVLALKALVEDESCLKRETNVEEWLGFWLLIFWEFIPQLHQEHQRLKPMTGGGPAPGLRSHQPPPRPVLPDIPVIPVIPSRPSNTPISQCPRLEFAMHDLYA